MAVSENPAGNVPLVDDVLSSDEKKLHHTTSPDENCIESDFQTDLFIYVDLRKTYLAFKLKLANDRG